MFKAEADAGLLHMAEFLHAVRARQQPSCSMEDAARSTATVQLAMIAYETGLPVSWDAAAERITNNAAGQGLLKREYRPPWKHPYSG